MTTIEIEDQTKYKTSDRTESEMDHYFDAGADEHRGSGKRNKMKRLIATQSIVNNSGKSGKNKCCSGGSNDGRCTIF